LSHPNRKSSRFNNRDDRHPQHQQIAKHSNEKDSRFNLPVVISIIALTISVLSFWQSYQSHKHDTAFDTVQKAYQTYYDLGKIQLDHWELNHLLTLSDRYDDVVKEICVATSDANPAKRSEYLVKERALADFIFTFYEQTLYQWNYTKVDERKFLNEVLSYLTDRLLRNPRLLYYWSEKGGNLQRNYERLTQEHYRNNVVNSTKNPLAEQPDDYGPFSVKKRDLYLQAIPAGNPDEFTK
jgi:hypothetical protein